jgi:hypothetical protein
MSKQGLEILYQFLLLQKDKLLEEKAQYSRLIEMSKSSMLFDETEIVGNGANLSEKALAAKNALASLDSVLDEYKVFLVKIKAALANIQVFTELSQESLFDNKEQEDKNEKLNTYISCLSKSIAYEIGSSSLKEMFSSGRLLFEEVDDSTAFLKDANSSKIISFDVAEDVDSVAKRAVNEFGFNMSTSELLNTLLQKNTKEKLD